MNECFTFAIRIIFAMPSQCHITHTYTFRLNWVGKKNVGSFLSTVYAFFRCLFVYSVCSSGVCVCFVSHSLLLVPTLSYETYLKVMSRDWYAVLFVHRHNNLHVFAIHSYRRWRVEIISIVEWLVLLLWCWWLINRGILPSKFHSK